MSVKSGVCYLSELDEMRLLRKCEFDVLRQCYGMSFNEKNALLVTPRIKSFGGYGGMLTRKNMQFDAFIYWEKDSCFYIVKCICNIYYFVGLL